MKKYLRILLCLGLLLQNFSFIIPVFAEEKKERLVINSITQGDTELEIIDDVYQVHNLERLITHYTLKNPISTKSYRLETIGINSSSVNNFSGLTEDYSAEDWNLRLDMNNEISYITYKLYDDKTNELLDTCKLTFKFTNFNDYNLSNSKLYITEITQGGNIVSPNEKGYEFNNIQDITMKLKGENFKENVIYPLYNGWSSFDLEREYSGKELNDGIEVILPIKDKEWHSINYRIYYEAFEFGIDAKPISCKDDYYCNFNYEFKEAENVGNYNLNLSYNNYNNKIKNLREYNENYQNMYVVSSQYHNNDNTLNLNVNGKNYLNKDYNVNINIIRNKNIIYTKNISVNGLLLNNEYSIELDNFVSSKEKTYDEEKDKYIIEVNIDYTTAKLEYMYGYLENYATVDSEIFFENGKKNLSTFRGDGNYYFISGVADTNKDAFKKFNHVYLRYLGNEFDENLNYDYEFSYGYSDNQGGLEKVEILKTGSITGKILNNVGLMFAVDNKNNYRYPTYRLEIKYNDEIIYYSSPVLDLVETPTLANVSLTNGNNKDLYLRMDDYTYIATRNFPLTLAISGIGFEDKKDYTIEFSEGYWYEDGSDDHTMKEYTFKGKDLNSGKAKIKLSKKITDNIISADLYVMYQEENGFGQGGFTINFVNSKDLIPNIKQYFIDDASDLIKNIKKNTSVEDFSNNIEVINNGKVKVFDKTGTNEITGNVGTGMIARVVNEYDQNILDMDVVVKGDVSGDGNISITDVVNVAQHMADVKKLDGVYEVAANVTDTGSIGVTDLVQISQDVARIKEVQ